MKVTYNDGKMNFLRKQEIKDLKKKIKEVKNETKELKRKIIVCFRFCFFYRLIFFYLIWIIIITINYF